MKIKEKYHEEITKGMYEAGLLKTHNKQSKRSRIILFIKTVIMTMAIPAITFVFGCMIYFSPYIFENMLLLFIFDTLFVGGWAGFMFFIILDIRCSIHKLKKRIYYLDNIHSKN